MKQYVTNIVTSRSEKNNRQAINLYGRAEDGSAETISVHGFKDYFYAAADEVRANEQTLLSHEKVDSFGEGGHESLFGETVSKIVLNDYYSKREVASIFDNSFESDVFVTNRFRIDTELFTGVEVPSNACHVDEIEPIDFVTEPRILTFDIETDDRGAFPELGEKRIISISAHDSYSDEYHGFIDTDGRSVAQVFPLGKPDGLDAQHYDSSESLMLERFAEWVSSYSFDIITGWNVEKFDCPYLVARMEKLGLSTDKLSREGYTKITSRGDARIKGHSIHDMLLAYKMTKRSELRSYSLDAVAEEELGEAKLDHTGESIWEMYQDDCDKLMRYNLKDVSLVVAIEEQAGVLGFKESLRNEVGVDLEGTTANNQYIEMMARRKLWEIGRVGPDATYEDKDAMYEGAYVFDAYTGVTQNVVGVDLSSLYPYTMAMINASPETKTSGPGVSCPNGATFDLAEDGIFKQLIDDAIGLKSDYKALRNQHEAGTEEYDVYSEKYDVSKTITNSVYGVAGWERFFLYDEAVAEAVTLMGQTVIKATQKYINDETLGEVIYGDTDSNYVRFPEEWSKDRCLEEAEKIASELNEQVYLDLAEEYGIPRDDCLWNIEVESYMERYFQAGQKKFYAYLCTWKDGQDCEPKISISGFGSQRSDSAMLTKRLQEEVLEMILHGASTEQIGKAVHEAAVSITPVDPDWESIGIPGGIGKELSQYAWTNGSPQGAHPRAAFFSNEINDTDYGGGSKPMRVYLKDVTPPIDGWDYGQIDVFAFEENGDMPEWAVLDANRMTETLITKPMDKILSAIDIEVAAAMKGQTQTGLAAFL